MSNPLGAHYPFPSIPHHWAQASFQLTIHLHLASPGSILRHFHFLPEDGQLDIWLGLFTRGLGVKGCLTVGHTQSAKHAFVGPRGVGAPSATGRVHGIVPASRGSQPSPKNHKVDVVRLVPNSTSHGHAPPLELDSGPLE